MRCSALLVAWVKADGSHVFHLARLSFLWSFVISLIDLNRRQKAIGWVGFLFSFCRLFVLSRLPLCHRAVRLGRFLSLFDLPTIHGKLLTLTRTRNSPTLFSLVPFFETLIRILTSYYFSLVVPLPLLFFLTIL